MFEQVLDEFEAAWRAGERPELRLSLEKVAASRRASLLFELLMIEVFYRRRLTEDFTSDEYVSSWPEYRSVVARVFAESEVFGGEQQPEVTSPDRTSPNLFSHGDENGSESNDDPMTLDAVYSGVANLVPGVMVGHYRLVKPLGVGGMGQVWLAEQEVPVRRQVALKLIKPELNSREVLARFAAERQALALMDHPNIARILDAGTTASGQPFFAMEFVSGLPLTNYCDQHQLTIKERLELFATVCQGVQHAHHKGIIHRDLKPNNILVTEVDGRPQPKVIDFGLAKALEDQQRLTDHSQFTRLGQILGTLKYMSPEQAQLGVQDIDTRTDIYALGVILYELLTGTTPLDDSSLRGQAILQALQILRDKEPIKPSSKLSSSTQAELSSITAQRKTDSSRLRSVLRGELDWIVMKALEKERDRRYESAVALAEDVRRCLAGHPVGARPPSWWYRSQKFLRRNSLGTAVTALVLLASVVIGVQAYRVTAANELLRRQKLTSSFVEIVNRRVDAQRGWTWKNREAISAVARHGAAIVEAANWRSELLAAHATGDIIHRETLLPKATIFDIKFHPQQDDEVFAIDQKGTVLMPRIVRKLKLREVGVDEEEFRYAPDRIFELRNTGKQDGGRFASIDPSGELVAWGTRAGDVIVRRYDRLDQDVKRIKAGSSESRCVTFSPDGRYLFTLNEPKLQRYDVENGFALDRESEVELGLHFKANPRDGTIRMAGGTEYDLDLNLVATHDFPNGHWNPTFSPDGFYLAATDSFRRVGLYGLNSTEVLRVLGEASEVINLSFSPDGRFLCATGEEQAKLWDLYDGRLMFDAMLSRGGRIKGVFARDGKTFLLSNRPGLERYDLQNSELFRVCGIGPQPVHSFRKIGDDLLVVYHSFDVQQITVAHWEWSSGRMKNFIVLRPDELGAVLPVLIDEEKQRAVVGWLTSAETVVCVLDLQQPDWQTAQRQLFLIPGILKWAAVQDDQILVSRHRAQWMWRGWQGEPDRIVLDISLNDAIYGNAKVTVMEQQGSRMFAGNENGDLYCFETVEGQRVASGRISSGASVSAVGVSPNGQRVAVGTVRGEVSLAGLANLKERTVWQVGDDEVTALAWIDEQTLVSANRAGQVVVWSLSNEQPQRYATLLRTDSPVVRMIYCAESEALLIQQEKRYGVGVFSWRKYQEIIQNEGLADDK